MLALYLVFYVIALVLFALAGLGRYKTPYNFMAGGLFFLALVSTLQVLDKMN